MKFLGVLMGTLSLGVIVIGSANSLVVLAIGCVLVGGGFASNVIESTLIQKSTDQSFLSRVFSVNILASFAALPISYVGAGALASAFGVRTVLVLGGLTSFVCSTLFFAWSARNDHGATERLLESRVTE